MASDEIRRHLRAALDGVIAEEKKRLNHLYEQDAALTTRKQRKLGPIVEALSSLKEEIGAVEGIGIDPFAYSPSVLVESWGRKNRYEISTTLDGTNFEMRDSYSYWQPEEPDDIGENVHRFEDQEALMEFIIRAIGKHIAQLHPKR